MYLVASARTEYVFFKTDVYTKENDVRSEFLVPVVSTHLTVTVSKPNHATHTWRVRSSRRGVCERWKDAKKGSGSQVARLLRYDVRCLATVRGSWLAPKRGRPSL